MSRDILSQTGVSLFLDAASQTESIVATGVSAWSMQSIWITQQQVLAQRRRN
jgi:hypothetical protein